MRKSRDVSLTVLAALSFATIACRNQPAEVRNCVDAQGRIVPDTNCQNQPHGGAFVPLYRYVYGGASGGHLGDAVLGGHAASSAEEGVSRGGFGHAGGEGGEGGGHGGGE